ncbi:acetylglutamate kinase [Rapidithrix thailandica]|uniref:Acetylglutamate kinase n=1 Tax=Rapidithrix thailandica TaxID=413964 RepID=A0AAW9S5X4_9BACT
MEKIHIIKIGGNIIDNPERLNTFLKDFAVIPGKKVLVHGGGKIASDLSLTLGISPKLIDGRRVTDADSLKVVTMVYGGLINKNVVAQLQAHQCNAIGLTGADGNIIQAHKRVHPQIDYGFVGDIDKVDGEKLDVFLKGGFVPVFAALTHDQQGTMLNTNADTIAAQLAIALSGFYQTELVYCFEKKGVLKSIDNENSVIRQLDETAYQHLKQEGVIAAGMIPKLDNAFETLHKGVHSVIIGKAEDLLHSITENDVLGTLLQGPVKQ